MVKNLRSLTTKAIVSGKQKVYKGMKSSEDPARQVECKETGRGDLRTTTKQTSNDKGSQGCVGNTRTSATVFGNAKG